MFDFLVIFAKICHHNVIWRSEVVCHTQFWQWLLQTVLTMTMKLDSCSKINMHDWNFSAIDNFCFNIKKYVDQTYPMIQQLKAAHLQVLLLLSVFTVLQRLLWSCHTRNSGRLLNQTCACSLIFRLFQKKLKVSYNIWVFKKNNSNIHEANNFHY